MIRAVSFSNVNNFRMSFGANMNTRQILAEMDNDDFEGFGRPNVKKMPNPRHEKIMAYKKAAGDSLYYKGCKRKTRYTSVEAVLAAKKKFESLRRVVLDFYECPLCNGWHLCKAGNKFKINVPM